VSISHTKSTTIRRSVRYVAGSSKVSKDSAFTKQSTIVTLLFKIIHMENPDSTEFVYILGIALVSACFLAFFLVTTVYDAEYIGTEIYEFKHAT
jgi:RsiW-degrading membrane proteinase PrsW (M82 family)